MGLENHFSFRFIVSLTDKLKLNSLKISRTLLLELEQKQHGGQAEKLSNCYKEGEMDKEEKTMPFELGPEQGGIFNNRSK